jgi:YD repeat-containing protein
VFLSPESQAEVANPQSDEQESHPARFCDTGIMKKIRGVGRPPASPLVRLSYGYDGFGDCTSLSDSLGEQVIYSYNGHRQLTSLTMSLAGVRQHR